MSKTQLNVRLPDDVVAAARQAADSRHMSVQDYIEHLIRTDTDPLRASFFASAEAIIAEHGDWIEERARAPRD
ncbi:hypothetical protein [Streptomyces sp. NPDC002758]